MSAHAYEEGVVTREMCDTLKRLQTVRDYDYDGAYRAAFSGMSGFRPLNEIRDDGTAIAAAFFQGQALALDVWIQRHELDAA